MERVGDWVRGIPPVTRYWAVAIFATATAISLKLVSKTSLFFNAEKAFNNQSWRFFSSFFYFNELSVELLINIFFLVRSCRLLEESFFTRPALLPSSAKKLNERQMDILQKYIDRNKSIDYFYFILQICVSIILLASYGHYRLGFKASTLLGVLLDDILLYIWCRSNPDLEVNMLGFFTIKTAYVPWFHTVLYGIMDGSLFKAIGDLLRGQFSFFESTMMWRILMSYPLGHFWWFTREFLLSTLYHDPYDGRRKAREETLKLHKTNDLNIARDLLKALLLPPWYWVIIAKIKSNVA
ncbi:Der1-like family-domain-containing protein [Scheffersomyces xylosifermentans]|uniref:Der1-like family-domain-containing protein n=1 Tax=Scheffersomyces xylosifermentans TaxID=1304137 RepID=UPI00315CEDBE